MILTFSYSILTMSFVHSALFDCQPPNDIMSFFHNIHWTPVEHILKQVSPQFYIQFESWQPERGHCVLGTLPDLSGPKYNQTK